MITTVIVKLEDRKTGILTEELKSYLTKGYDIIQTLPIEEEGKMYLLFTLRKGKKETKLSWVLLILIVQLTISTIGVIYGIH